MGDLVDNGGWKSTVLITCDMPRLAEWAHWVARPRHSGRVTTPPVGYGGEEPRISEQMLQLGDRVLCFTDGLIEDIQLPDACRARPLGIG
ncbi:hypothetical protein ACFZCP_02820 [Streptomyces sp. NPDC007971]|uniref:hypothetical protein n=1 Tax=Streptomyces sp. NPDC007971 TaxID=3364799 RepID=UPI0036E4277F